MQSAACGCLDEPPTFDLRPPPMLFEFFDDVNDLSKKNYFSCQVGHDELFQRDFTFFGQKIRNSIFKSPVVVGSTNNGKSSFILPALTFGMTILMALCLALVFTLCKRRRKCPKFSSRKITSKPVSTTTISEGSKPDYSNNTTNSVLYPKFRFQSFQSNKKLSKSPTLINSTNQIYKNDNNNNDKNKDLCRIDSDTLHESPVYNQHSPSEHLTDLSNGYSIRNLYCYQPSSSHYEDISLNRFISNKPNHFPCYPSIDCKHNCELTCKNQLDIFDNANGRQIIADNQCSHFYKLPTNYDKSSYCNHQRSKCNLILPTVCNQITNSMCHLCDERSRSLKPLFVQSMSHANHRMTSGGSMREPRRQIQQTFYNSNHSPCSTYCRSTKINGEQIKPIFQNNPHCGINNNKRHCPTCVQTLYVKKFKLENSCQTDFSADDSGYCSRNCHSVKLSKKLPHFCQNLTNNDQQRYDDRDLISSVQRKENIQDNSAYV